MCATTSMLRQGHHLFKVCKGPAQLGHKSLGLHAHHLMLCAVCLESPCIFVRPHSSIASSVAHGHHHFARPVWNSNGRDGTHLQ